MHQQTGHTKSKLSQTFTDTANEIFEAHKPEVKTSCLEKDFADYKNYLTEIIKNS